MSKPAATAPSFVAYTPGGGISYEVAFGLVYPRMANVTAVEIMAAHAGESHILVMLETTQTSDAK